MYNDTFKLRCKNAPLAIDITQESRDTNPHIHKEIEVIYVAKGETDVKIGAHSFSAIEGDLIFANPMEVHSLYPHKNKDYIHYCICFDSSIICDRKIAELLSGGTMLIAHLVKASVVVGYFKKLFEISQKDDDTLMLEAGAYVSLILAELISSGQVTKIANLDKSAMFYSKVMSFIDANYGENITSADVAKEFFYTQSHFCRTFSKKFGTTFSDFLNIYRVSKAKDMLDKREVKISDVASACGFDSLNYFSKCFKRHVRMSPSEYKKYQ